MLYLGQIIIAKQEKIRMTNSNVNLEKEGIVSIWVGNFNSQQEFDDFFEEKIIEDIEKPINKFSQDIEIGFYDHDFQEADYFGKELSIEDLLAPFSYSYSFINEAVSTASEKDIYKANSAVLLFDCEYNGKISSKFLRFLGNFEYDKDDLLSSESQ